MVAWSPPRLWRAEWWVLGALLLALPTLALPPTGPWVAVKAYLLLAAGVLLAGLAVLRGEWTPAQAGLAVRRPVNALILAFLAWVLLSAGLSGFSGAARYEAVRHLGGVLLFFGLLHTESLRRHLGRLVLLVGLAAAAATAVAFAGPRDGSVLRVSGAFHNPQLLAGFLCLLTPLVLVGSQLDDRGRRRSALQVMLVVMVAGILVTENRSAWVGSLVGLTLLLALWARFGRDPDAPFSRGAILVPVAVVAIALTAFLGWSRLGPSLSGRVATVSALQRDQSFQWRLGMWSKAWSMARDRPVLGFGVGSFPVEQALYFDSRVPPRTQREILQQGASLSENAHNSYLQIAAEMGFPGAALFLGIVAAFFATGLRAVARLKPGLRQGVLMASLAGLAAQSVSAIGSPAWEFAECSAFWWLTLGVGMVSVGAPAERAGHGYPGMGVS